MSHDTDKDRAVKHVEDIIAQFVYLSTDVEDLMTKTWLKTAMISHITERLKLPKEVVEKTVDLIYLADNI